MAGSNFSRLKSFSDLLEKCGRCGDCTYAVKVSTARKHVYKPCPVYNVLGFETYSAKGRIIILQSLLEGKIKPDDRLLEWAYLCLTCGNCKETCLAVEGGIDIPSIIEALREDLVSAGMHLEKHLEIRDKALRNYNPYGEPHDQRFSFLNVSLPKEADIVYFVGCTSAYRRQEIAKATVALLEKASVDFTILEDERCCGSTLFRLGYRDDAMKLAEHNISMLEKTGAKTVIFSCAGCYRTFKKDYASLEPNFQVLHVSEFLKELVDKGKLHFYASKPVRVTYHDPCHLGRHTGIYEEPRSLIRQIGNVELVEMITNRNYAHCCGAGSGVKGTFPEIAVKIAKQRIEEATLTGAEILLSTCPFCKTNLADASDGIAVLDLTEFLLQSITEEPVEVEVKAPSPEESLAETFKNYLNQHPEIFEDLVEGATMDFAIYDSIDAFENEEKPVSVFNVVRTGNGIKISNGRANAPDMEIAFSEKAVEKLVKSKSRQSYAKLFGTFYNEPTEEEWIDFQLYKRTRALINMGYGKFAEEAGVLREDEY